MSFPYNVEDKNKTHPNRQKLFPLLPLNWLEYPSFGIRHAAHAYSTIRLCSVVFHWYRMTILVKPAPLESIYNHMVKKKSI